jgi:hypothetical protein
MSGASALCPTEEIVRLLNRKQLRLEDAVWVVWNAPGQTRLLRSRAIAALALELVW